MILAATGLSVTEPELFESVTSWKIGLSFLDRSVSEPEIETNGTGSGSVTGTGTETETGFATEAESESAKAPSLEDCPLVS